MQSLYPLIDAAAGWGLVLVCVALLALRYLQVRYWRTALVMRAAPGPLTCLTVGGAALAAFAVLARAVASEPVPAWLSALDAWGLTRNPGGPDAALAAVAAFTHLGDSLTVTGVAGIVGAVLLWRRQWAGLCWWALASLGNGLLVRWCKQVFGRYRPDAPYLEVHGFSFPSGHAMSSMVVYGLLVIVLWGWARDPALPAHSRAGRALRAAAFGVAGLTLAIGLSRVWLQVHYASDVLAGWMLGIAWLAVLCLLARPARGG
ncbi:phosphatase PAP2 family protein [Verticiella sediminum]|uniref:Phosphatase PAP2 family protein n=1 Tax=Verticiella sediminum TaxID=1247510 RepID=A0A556ANP4_9BURK|nr:phosphatase PAP2 family protein [Verticiella sediminum]TSH94508.1 phosphatase PAP2 family protein [Verticiella sediminum]